MLRWKYVRVNFAEVSVNDVLLPHLDKASVLVRAKVTPSFDRPEVDLADKLNGEAAWVKLDIIPRASLTGVGRPGLETVELGLVLSP